MNLSNAILKHWNEENQDIEVKRTQAIDTVQVNEDSLEIVIDDADVCGLEIPMTPSNIRVLKKQVFKSGNPIQKSTDSKGRFNLGVDFSNQDLEVLTNERE